MFTRLRILKEIMTLRTTYKGNIIVNTQTANEFGAANALAFVWQPTVTFNTPVEYNMNGKSYRIQFLGVVVLARMCINVCEFSLFGFLGVYLLERLRRSLP